MIALLAMWLATAGPGEPACPGANVPLPPQARCLSHVLRQARTCSPATLAGWGLTLPGARHELPPPPDGDKQTRDAFGAFPFVIETDNFALKWGSYLGFTHDDAVAVAAALEQAWAEEVDRLGYPQPVGTEAFRFNVYIGDTGAGAPRSLGAAGYFWYDVDSWPMIVLAPATVADLDTGELTAAHELFHGIQDAIGTYAYDGQAAWYYEATASWIESEVHPDNDGYASFLFAFALRPELPLNHFDYPDTGAIEEYHQYGAFVFLEHVADVAGGPEITRRSFLEAPAGGDPLVVLDGLLVEAGSSIAEVYFDHADRNATWDYPREAAFEEWIDAYGGYDSDWSTRPSGRIGPDGDWHRVEANAPRTFGANYWEAVGLPTDFEIAFEGDDGPRWHVALATQRGVEHTVAPLELDGGVGRITVRDYQALGREAWIVVAAAETPVDTGAAWAYELRVTEVDPDTSDSGEHEEDALERPRRACACASDTGGSAGSIVLFLAAALVGRRRRRRTGIRTSTRQNL